jgi:hypothetical protein
MKNYRDNEIILYHGTDIENIPSIKKHGIVRNYKISGSGTPDSAPSGIYLAASKEEASKYGDGAVITVKIDKSEIKPDDHDSIFDGKSFYLDIDCIPTNKIISTEIIPLDPPILILPSKTVVIGEKAKNYFHEQIKKANYTVNKAQMAEIEKATIALSED